MFWVLKGYIFLTKHSTKFGRKDLCLSYLGQKRAILSCLEHFCTTFKFTINTLCMAKKLYVYSIFSLRSDQRFRELSRCATYPSSSVSNKFAVLAMLNIQYEGEATVYVWFLGQTYTVKKVPRGASAIARKIPCYSWFFI